VNPRPPFPDDLSPDELRAAEAMDAVFEGLFEGRPPNRHPAKEEPVLPSASQALAETARALHALPEPDAKRMQATRASLEARFARNHASRPSSLGDEGGLPAWVYLGLLLGLLGLAWLALGRSPAATPEPANLLSEADTHPVEGAPGRKLDQAAGPDDVDGDGDGDGESNGDIEPIADADIDTDTDTRTNSETEPVAATDTDASASPTAPIASSSIRGGAPATPAPALPAQPSRAIVRGYVRDVKGRGIPDAHVTAWRVDGPGFYVQRSEADGAYRLELGAGRYLMQAEAEGFAGRWHDADGGSAGRDGAGVLEMNEAGGSTVDFVLPRNVGEAGWDRITGPERQREPS
jgi:hypothetical protein